MPNCGEASLLKSNIDDLVIDFMENAKLLKIYKKGDPSWDIEKELYKPLALGVKEEWFSEEAAKKLVWSLIQEVQEHNSNLLTIVSWSGMDLVEKTGLYQRVEDIRNGEDKLGEYFLRETYVEVEEEHGGKKVPVTKAIGAGKPLFLLGKNNAIQEIKIEKISSNGEIATTPDGREIPIAECFIHKRDAEKMKDKPAKKLDIADTGGENLDALENEGSEAIDQGSLRQASEAIERYFTKEKINQAKNVNGKVDPNLIAGKINKFQAELVEHLAGLAVKDMVSLDNPDEVVAKINELLREKPKADRRLFGKLFEKPERKVEKFTTEQEEKIIGECLLKRIKASDSELSKVPTDELEILIEDDIKTAHDAMMENFLEESDSDDEDDKLADIYNRDDIEGFVEGDIVDDKTLEIINKIRTVLNLPPKDKLETDDGGRKETNSGKENQEGKTGDDENIELDPEELIKQFGIEKAFQEYLESPGGNKEQKEGVVKRVRKELTKLLRGNNFDDVGKLNEAVRKIVEGEKSKLGEHLEKHFTKLDDDIFDGSGAETTKQEDESNTEYEELHKEWDDNHAETIIIGQFAKKLKKNFLELKGVPVPGLEKELASVGKEVRESYDAVIDRTQGEKSEEGLKLYAGVFYASEEFNEEEFVKRFKEKMDKKDDPKTSKDQGKGSAAPPSAPPSSPAPPDNSDPADPNENEEIPSKYQFIKDYGKFGPKKKKDKKPGRPGSETEKEKDRWEEVATHYYRPTDGVQLIINGYDPKSDKVKVWTSEGMVKTGTYFDEDTKKRVPEYEFTNEAGERTLSFAKFKKLMEDFIIQDDEEKMKSEGDEETTGKVVQIDRVYRNENGDEIEVYSYEKRWVEDEKKKSGRRHTYVYRFYDIDGKLKTMDRNEFHDKYLKPEDGFKVIKNSEVKNKNILRYQKIIQKAEREFGRKGQVYENEEGKRFTILKFKLTRKSDKVRHVTLADLKNHKKVVELTPRKLRKNIKDGKLKKVDEKGKGKKIVEVMEEFGEEGAVWGNEEGTKLKVVRFELDGKEIVEFIKLVNPEDPNDKATFTPEEFRRIIADGGFTRAEEAGKNEKNEKVEMTGKNEKVELTELLNRKEKKAFAMFEEFTSEFLDDIERFDFDAEPGFKEFGKDERPVLQKSWRITFWSEKLPEEMGISGSFRKEIIDQVIESLKAKHKSGEISK